MGKKRLTDMSTTKVPQKEKTEDKKQKQVKTGKKQGRITDMSALAMAEAEEIKQKDKELEKLADQKTKETEGTKEPKKTKKKKKKKGRRYLAAKKQVDRNKAYPLSKAVALVKKTSLSSFKGKIEFHLTVKEKGLKRQIELPYPLGKEKKMTISTEKKFPLIHLIIGQVDSKDKNLAANVQVIIEAIGPKNIKKAVLTATMGPGVKIDFISPEK